MPPKRMTANPTRPARYRPGKVVAEEPSSSSEESEEETTQQPIAKPIPPKATSFPSNTNKQIDPNVRRHEEVTQNIEEEGFVTEEEDSSQSSNSARDEESSNEDESSEEESSSEEEPRLLRPTFIRKEDRQNARNSTAQDSNSEAANDEARRKERADALVQEQLDKDAAARAAGKKSWDDDEEVELELVDDRDGIDPDAEYAAWKLRELKRVKRDREAIEATEKEREEIERRRNLAPEEREKEDQKFLEQQKEEREGRGKMAYLQRYFHKGAFFQDEKVQETLRERDLMGSRFVDETDRGLLPEYMQIRDLSKLGKKGRTRYKDLRNEDTGRWGDFGDKAKKDGSGGKVDERFMPGRQQGGPAATGANAGLLGERGQVDRAPGEPKAMRKERRYGGGGRDGGRDESGDSYRSGQAHNRDRYGGRDTYRMSRSPRRRSRTRSRSRPRGDYDDMDRRKRSSSSQSDRHRHDKRRRVEAT
ncbi:MAG: hypothetical protein M1834_003397 [Cirrosporium novae-zelandiae]|nr:MAG: hypothetical protein M1834_003397 [Cirrosporium novae-zelandiae]